MDDTNRTVRWFTPRAMNLSHVIVVVTSMDRLIDVAGGSGG
jgi:hypothetical protein